MRALRFWLVLAILTMVSACRLTHPQQSEQPPARNRPNIRRLLALTGQDQRINELAALVRSRGETAARFGGRMPKAVDPQSLVKKAIDIHAKYLSDDDVVQITRFYETPVGKRLAAAQPMLVAEFARAASEWETELRPIPPKE